MKIGFVADAHGNPRGLQLCLDRLNEAGVGRVCFLGDAVGYFPEGSSVLDLLLAKGTRCLRGNHEAMLLGELPVSPEAEEVCRLGQAKRRLAARETRELAAWQESAEITTNGRRILCMHGRPDDRLQGYFYPDADMSRLGEIEADVLVMAHTHHPFVRRWEGKWVLNPGSCGLPRQGGGFASCAVYDTASDEAWLLHTALPVDELVRIYQKQVHPKVLETLMR